MAHEFNFKQKFSKELKKEIINTRAQKYIAKFGADHKEAMKRAKAEMMPTKVYVKFAKIAQAICDLYDIPTDTDYISISTNRNGEHSWYIYLDGIDEYNELTDVRIRISDHETSKMTENEIQLFPLIQSLKSMLKQVVKEYISMERHISVCMDIHKQNVLDAYKNYAILLQNTNMDEGKMKQDWPGYYYEIIKRYGVYLNECPNFESIIDKSKLKRLLYEMVCANRVYNNQD